MANQFTNQDDEIAAAVAARKATLEAYQARLNAADADPTNYSPDYSGREGGAEVEGYSWDTSLQQYVSATAPSTATNPQLMAWIRFHDSNGFSYAACDTKVAAGDFRRLDNRETWTPSNSLWQFMGTGVTRDTTDPGEGGFVFNNTDPGILSHNCSLWTYPQTSAPQDFLVSMTTWNQADGQQPPESFDLTQRQSVASTSAFHGQTFIEPNAVKTSFELYMQNKHASQGLGIYHMEWQVWWQPIEAGSYTLVLSS